MAKPAKVYINGRLIGFHESAEKLADIAITARREGSLPKETNIAHHKDTNEIYINTDAGRLQRPLIVVTNGKSTYTKELAEQVQKGELTYQNLIEKGVIEYLDSEEEENALVAENEEMLNSEHSHLEINGAAILSVISSMVPFVEHDMAGKALHGDKMFKQAIGVGAINYKMRHDTEGYLLYYPEKNIIKTKTMDVLELDRRPQQQNFVVAIMPYYGFNTMDALVLNQGAVDRGLGRACYYRGYEASEQRYPGGQRDKFEIPTEEKVGYIEEEKYNKLGIDGLSIVESAVNPGDAVIGITAPPKFFEEMNDFGVDNEQRRDASIKVRKRKDGFVDTVIITEGPDGSRLAKIKVRTTLKPAVGDKLASRHGQKGVVSYIVPEADMPFTVDGIRPDLILNPHSIPSRMTMGHLLEMLGGKAGSAAGQIIDGTPFNGTPQEDMEKMLTDRGFRADGMEIFYDGITGKRIQGAVFTGVIPYQKLYHVVAHKIQARARGPVQMLTRQPTEGKEKEGGLRFGEMEGETLVGHGAAMLLQEKMIEDSDKFVALVDEDTGMIGFRDEIRRKNITLGSKGGKMYPVEISYGFKLLLEELKALGILAKIKLKDKV